jgi:hypothetical protein
MEYMIEHLLQQIVNELKRIANNLEKLNGQVNSNNLQENNKNNNAEAWINALKERRQKP